MKSLQSKRAKRTATTKNLHHDQMKTNFELEVVQKIKELLIFV